MKVLILDFYVDEPACFGVPPYISPYIRYTAGALVLSGILMDNIDYLTIDEFRESGFRLREVYNFVYIIMGSTVPGKYLGGRIGTIADLYKTLDNNKNRETAFIIGGPVRYASKDIKQIIVQKQGLLIRGDIERYPQIFTPIGAQKTKEQYLGDDLKLKRSYFEVDQYARVGAFITQKHPNYPYLILEIETYRGCTRDVYCSFCTEAFYGKPVFRETEGILDEVHELHNLGNYYFRIGRQADIMTYLPYMDNYKGSFPRPNPKSIEALYTGFWRVAPNTKLLHLDNVNPGLIANFPKESEEIVQIITTYNTEGDTAAMGVESVDDLVIEKNDLKCNQNQALQAIRLINQYGAKRVSGIPKLLPGLNFISGLAGEDDKTFQKNFVFLQTILDEGLMLRRINIRQVLVYEKTKLHRNYDQKKQTRIENRFKYYKEKIRKEIDMPMLKRVFVQGSVLKNVILEKESNGYYLGRQLGSYPITVKVLSNHKKYKLYQEPLDIVVTGYSERSISGLPSPLPINYLTDLSFRELPDIGKKQATDAKLRQPYLSMEDIQHRSPELCHTIEKYKISVDFTQNKI